MGFPPVQAQINPEQVLTAAQARGNKVEGETSAPQSLFREGADPASGRLVPTSLIRQGRVRSASHRALSHALSLVEGRDHAVLDVWISDA